MDEHLGQSRPPVLSLAMPCDLAQVRNAVKAVHDFMTSLSCGDDEMMDCELALAEACNNAIKYAEGDLNPVLVEILCEENQIELRVTDSTPGFDWPKQASLPGPESESGRGLCLIQSLTDYVNYFRSESGNILVMRKKRV